MVSERHAFPVGLCAAIDSTKSVEVWIAGMTTIQMVKQKGQCNGDEIHAKIATIRHCITGPSWVRSLRLTFRPRLQTINSSISRARERLTITLQRSFKWLVTPPPLKKAEICVKNTRFGKKAIRKDTMPSGMLLKNF